MSASGRDAAELPLLRGLRGGTDRDPVLRLAGEIDLTTTDVLAAAVDQCLQRRPVRLTVDLHEVTFCDCAGIQELQHARQRAAAAGTGLRLTGLTPPVLRVLTLTDAADLLSATVDPVRPDELGGLLVPPGPLPDAVSAARRQLNELYASGVERLLWELDKQPMPDLDAIRRAITAAGNGDSGGLAPSLVLLQAARLKLDRLEAEAFDAAYAAGIGDETLAGMLELPGAQAAAAWYRWLATRQALPYDEPRPARRAVPGGAADDAASAGRRAHQAATRVAQIAQRLEQLHSADGNRPSAIAGEARILADEAIERATLGLVRAAEALEWCAAGYERLARADSARSDEYRQEAAWYWRTAQKYRQQVSQEH